MQTYGKDLLTILDPQAVKPEESATARQESLFDQGSTAHAPEPVHSEATEVV